MQPDEPEEPEDDDCEVQPAPVWPTPFGADRLTSAAWRAFRRAALAAGRGPIGPEHLNPALAALPKSVARSALAKLGLDWDALGLPRLLPERTTSGPEATLTPDAATFLRAAAAVAHRLGHHPVGTGHLLLALLATEVGPTPAGLNPARFEAALLDVLGTWGSDGPALDGEHILYLTHDEALVLFALLARRPLAINASEAVVIRDLRALLRAACESDLNDRGIDALDDARREVLRLARAPRVSDHLLLPPLPREG